MMQAVLSKETIRDLIQRDPPLLEDYLDLSSQLQPNGFDLTLGGVAMLQSAGRLGVAGENRILADLAPLVFDGFGFVYLIPGAYSITYNEVVHLPCDIMALGRPRSSLLRCGATIHSAVWDAGYSGRSQSLLVVYNPQGIELQKNARLLQLVFLALGEETEPYQGIYQGENI